MTAHRQPTSRRGRHKARLLKLAGGLALAAVYWSPVRRWYSRWGTTPEELVRVMSGDGLIANPTNISMLSVTVNAPPSDIWPWLVQIGYQRVRVQLLAAHAQVVRNCAELRVGRIKRALCELIGRLVA